MNSQTDVNDSDIVSSDSDDTIKSFLDQYKKYSENLQSANSKTQEELDKSLITLSTVIIGVILTLRQQIASSVPNIGFPVLMWIAITLLITCVLSVLISHFLSLWVNRRLIESIDNLQQAEDPVGFAEEVQRAHERTLWVSVNNYISAGLFFLGLVAAVSFAIYGASLKG